MKRTLIKIRTDLKVKELEQLYAISPNLKECDFTKAKRTP
jgi:hypothetical protein